MHVHLNAAIRVGLTRQEAIEALLQCSLTRDSLKC
nr:hypothetical protein [Paenibacillus protaetiae]